VARALAAAGADVILGHHPHVVQPLEWVDSGGRRAVVVYSLGNFISNQERTYDADHQPAPEGDDRDGSAFRCRLVLGPAGTAGIQVAEARCEPLWTDNNWAAHRAGREKLRAVHVLRMDEALGRTRAELASLADPQAMGGGAGREARLGDLRRLERTLAIRRERWGKVMGSGGGVAPADPPVSSPMENN
jgi:poly-gamma-glutamate synthesis protein (capsule biosynthesis protein)